MPGITTRNPYVGPRPIQQGEPLYGRTTEVGELYHRLQARRIVVLHSPSGAGKSSLVQAGLIPKLREGKFDVWKPIRVNLDPRGLEGIPEGTNRYLLSALLSLEEELPPERRRTPAVLAGLEFLSYLEGRPRRKGREHNPVVLLFDQFEEVLTVAPRAIAEKRAFFDAVGKALDSEKYWALFIIREDYLAAFAPYRDHIPTQMSNTFRLDLLGLDGACEAAEKPAIAGGRVFPAVEQLIRDLSTVQVQQADGTFVAEQGLYVEPVQLQVVCRRLWEAMPADDVSIDADDIEKYAGVTTALGGYYADAVVRIAGGDVAIERAMREWVGNKLIVGGIRSQVRQEVGKSAGLDNGLIDGLLGSYLVRTEQRAGASWFELSHDRLLEPVLQDNQAWEEAHLHALQAQAKIWEAGKRAPGLLMSAEALPVAMAWAAKHPEWVTEGEREFLEQSRVLRAAERTARWRSRLITAVAVMVAVVVGVLGIKAWRAELAALEAKTKAEAAQKDAEEARNEANKEAENAKVQTTRAEAALKQAKEAKDAQEVASNEKLALVEKNLKDQQVAAEQAFNDALLEKARDFLDRGRPGLAAIILGEMKGSKMTDAWKRLATEIVTRLVPALMLRHQTGVLQAAWSPDGKHLVTTSRDNRSRVWNTDGSGVPRVFDGHTGTITSVAWSPNGNRIATSSWDKTARVWNPDGSGVFKVLQGHNGPVHSAAWSPDSNHIATASKDKTLRVWNVDSSGEPNVLEGHAAPVFSAAWSPDGKRIASASEDKTVRIWNVDGSGDSRVFKGHEGPVRSVTWSPDGKRIVSASDDKTARIWDVDGTDEPIVLSGHTGNVNSAVWSPDGKRIVTISADWTAQIWKANRNGIWNADSAQHPIVIRGHKGPVVTAAWRADGKRVITASSVGTVIIWDSEEFTEPIELRGHQRDVLSAAWSPKEDTRIVTASLDATVRFWNVPRDSTASIDAPLSDAGHGDAGVRKLKERLSRLTTECLLPAEWRKVIGVSQADAHRRYEACEHAHGRTPLPEVNSDEDGDGFEDSTDKCPLDPVGVYPDPESPGCPEEDPDNDEVYGPQDQCPLDPRGSHPDPKRRGCPDKDIDRDGIYDAEDKCPSQPPGRHPDPKRAGCPDKDTDRDGIYDAVDKCPDVPAGRHPVSWQPGCPDKDTDNDGVYDSLDRCPLEPKGTQADSSYPGCAMGNNRDNDGDGIPDRVDACPKEKGSGDSDWKKNGCPHPIRLTNREIVILQRLQFFPDSDRIMPDSEPTLIEMANVFKEHRNWAKVEVHGSVSASEDPLRDLELSTRRAQKVKRWLVILGVEPDRLVPRGYGSDDPANGTPEERDRNAGIWFKVLENKPQLRK